MASGLGEVLADLFGGGGEAAAQAVSAPAGREAGEQIGGDGRQVGGWTDGSKSLADSFGQAGIWDDTNPLYGIGL